MACAIEREIEVETTETERYTNTFSPMLYFRDREYASTYRYCLRFRTLAG